MGIADLANVPTTDTELKAWASLHFVHHRDIIRRVQERYGVRLDEYSLDPLVIDSGIPQSVGSWGYLHQIMHNQQNTVLQIAGNDLVDVTWQDPSERAEWVFLNFIEHQKAGAILGV